MALTAAALLVAVIAGTHMSTTSSVSTRDADRAYFSNVFGPLEYSSYNLTEYLLPRTTSVPAPTLRFSYTLLARYAEETALKRPAPPGWEGVKAELTIAATHLSEWAPFADMVVAHCIANTPVDESFTYQTVSCDPVGARLFQSVLLQNRALVSAITSARKLDSGDSEIDPMVAAGGCWDRSFGSELRQRGISFPREGRMEAWPCDAAGIR